MFENNGCCAPPQKKDDCCCKDGILCALDFFYQDFLVAPTGNNCITNGSLKYYPALTNVAPVTSNIIYGIPYIAPEIVPVYISSSNKDDITYLNICKIHGFEFKLKDGCTSKIETLIRDRFTKIKYCSPKNCCCKNGVIEYLVKGKAFLETPPLGNAIIISTSTESFKVDKIIAINPDTVWASGITNADSAQTTYYVLSICEISGITFDKAPLGT